MNFTCNGTVMAVRVAGRRRQNGNMQFPTLQIWRTNDGAYYEVRQQTKLRSAACEGGLRRQANDVLQCTLKPSVRHSVQSGDIIGFHLPPKNVGKFELYFTKFTVGPTNYIFLGPQNNHYNITNGYNTTIIPNYL